MKRANDLPVARSANVAQIRNSTVIQLDATTLPPDRNPALVYLSSLSAGSRPTMGGALAAIAAILLGGCEGAEPASFPWHRVRYQHAQAVRTALADRYAPATANKMLSALRGVLRESWRLGLMDSEEYHRAMDVKTVRGGGPSQTERGRHLSMGELSALMAACAGDGTDAGVRDAAIIALGYMCGLRRAELAGLAVDDFDAESRTLTVRGKGNKTRAMPVENGALDALSDWLEIRGGWPGPLFVAYRKGDHMQRDGLSTTAIHKLIGRRAKQAGVREFSPHDLRRTFAGDLLDAGADLATVQKMMGHASPTTTAGYDRRDARTRRDAAARLHISYRKRAK